MCLGFALLLLIAPLLVSRQLIRLDVPLMIGTAGTAGAAPHLDKTLAMVREIARVQADWEQRGGKLAEGEPMATMTFSKSTDARSMRSRWAPRRPSRAR